MNSSFFKKNRFKIIGIPLIAIGILFIYYRMNPSDFIFFPKCPFLLLTGLYCPGCGSQRAAHHLLHFDIFEAFQQNLLFFISLLMVLYYLFIEIINFTFQKKIPNYLNKSKTPLILLLLIIAFGILRNIPVFPFTLLAPN